MNAKHYYLSVLLLLVATLGLRAQSKTVTLTEAGTLGNFVSEAEQTSLTNLTVKGPINSVDILFIRGMAGNLKVLNLLDANIVYSEESYYGTGSNANHTQNDVVGDYMFYGMTALTKITLPKGVWSIGSWDQDNPWSEDKKKLNGNPSIKAYAFARCVNLQEVVLPAGLIAIGYLAFEYCTKLTTITLPDKLEYIGSEAFSECQALASINLPASLGVPTYMTDYDMQKDQYFTSTGGSEIFKNCVSLSKVTLAAGLKGLTFTMFSGCTALENITLPDGIVYLSSAFSNCSALKALNIPASVRQVSRMSGCSSLKELVIPEGVEEFDGNAFQDCKSLTKISLPSTLGNLPTHAFEGCSSLLSIEIPDKVLKIGTYAFQNCTALQSVSFPKDLSEIEDYAFHGCVSLTEANLPSKLLKMGDYVFSGCTSLATVTLPQSLSEIGRSAFHNCKKLTAVKLPGVLMDIKGSTFYNCTSLASVELPAGLLRLGEDAFYGCQALKKIVIPGGVQSISSGAFRNCGLEEVVLNEGLTTLANYSFSGCKSLQSVTFPSTIKTIGGFNGSGVRTVTFAKDAAPTSVTESAFADCENLQSIVLPNSVTTIGEEAFKNCSALKSITLSTGITEIPNQAFFNCYALASIVIPEGVTAIGSSAFSYTYKMASVKLPSTLTMIESSAFQGSGIESLVIPEGVTTIYGNTFNNCDSLVSVTLPASLTRLTRRYNDESNDNAQQPFGGCGRLANLDLSKCQLAELPENAFENLPIRSLDLSAATLTVIPNALCLSCDSLRSIKLADGITQIGQSAFSSCDSLTVTAWPTALTTIVNGAFSDIKTVTAAWPAKLTSIGSNAFYDVTFDDLVIPETITRIEDNAFDNAEVTGTLTINPAASLSLGDRAFNCAGSKYNKEGQYYSYHLSTVNWNSIATFPKEKFCQIDNLYLPEGGKASSEENIGYIFYNGITDLVEIKANYDGGRSFYEVKQPMKTRKVFYSKYFNKTSGFGEAAGWETLVLPFKVMKITYTRGNDDNQETVTLAPFGSKELETEGVLPFWLYELGTDGNYKAATAIEAHKAYLICMPNNSAYPSANNIEGYVTFTAEDATNGVTLGVTEGALKPSTGTKFDLVPTYETVPHGINVYSLNNNSYYADDKTYPAGSVFVRDYEDVEPFEAYLVSKEAEAGTAAGRMFYAIGGGDGTITGIEDGPAMPDQATRAYSRGGVLYIQTNADRTIYIYNVQGQTVRIVNAHEGLNEVRGLEEGIYMLEGQKVVVK